MNLKSNPPTGLRAGRRPPSVLAGAVAFGCMAVAGGCASRAFPTTLPMTSPASFSAIRAPSRPIAVSLASDPPLPGEPADGWPDLGKAGGMSHMNHMKHEPPK